MRTAMRMIQILAALLLLLDPHPAAAQGWAAVDVGSQHTWSGWRGWTTTATG